MINPYYLVVLHTMIMIINFVVLMMNSKIILFVDMIHQSIDYIVYRISVWKKKNNNSKIKFQKSFSESFSFLINNGNSMHKQTWKHKKTKSQITKIMKQKSKLIQITNCMYIDLIRFDIDDWLVFLVSDCLFCIFFDNKQTSKN